MSTASPDFAAYFSKISVNRATLTNDLASLSLIQIQHLKSIAFENLDVVSKKIISIKLEHCFEKLVLQNRGGYCFEHNTLLAAALQSVGFKVIRTLARPRWRASSTGYPQTHMMLIVTTRDEVSYLVDAAFGGLQSLEPLCLDDDSMMGERPQVTKDGIFRVIMAPASEEEEDGRSSELIKQWQLKGEWTDLYSFKRTMAEPCDLVVSNWWSCTFPEARWVSHLFVAKIFTVSIGPNEENQRHYVLNDELVMRSSDGTAVRRKLSSVEELLGVLETVFGLSLPAGSIDIERIELFFQKGSVATFHNAKFIASD